MKKEAEEKFAVASAASACDDMNVVEKDIAQFEEDRKQAKAKAASAKAKARAKETAAKRARVLKAGNHEGPAPTAGLTAAGVAAGSNAHQG